MEPSSKQADLRTRQRLRKRPLGRYRYVRLRWRVLFAAVDFLGETLFSAVRILRQLAVRRKSASLGSSGRNVDPRRILLVQLDHLGDAIISTVMLPALRSRFPGASIEVLAAEANREVFESSPEVSSVHVCRVNRFARRRLARLAWIPATFWWGLRLRRRRIDLAIDPRGDFPSAVILRLCGAPRRVGWDCGGGGFLLTDRVDYVPDRPEIESRLALLAGLGIRVKESAARGPCMRPDGEAGQRVDRLAEESGVETLRGSRSSTHPTDFRSAATSFKRQTSHSVVLHVGAGTRAKQWPVSHWRELLGRLAVDLQTEVVLAGSRDDRGIAREILGDRRWPRVADWTGRLGFVELAALLQRAGVVVGADSGPAHLAAAVDVPLVVLFSGTNGPRQWQPRGRRVTVLRNPVACSPCHRERCPLADHPCMTGLHPQRVAAEVKRVLSVVPAENTENTMRESMECTHGGPHSAG